MLIEAKFFPSCAVLLNAHNKFDVEEALEFDHLVHYTVQTLIRSDSMEALNLAEEICNLILQYILTLLTWSV